MATRRRIKHTPEHDPTIELANLPTLPAPDAALTATEERREAELESILDEIGSESRIKVWQMTDGRSSYAGEMSGADFSLDVLLDTYGGGEKTLGIYQGRVRITTVKVSLDPAIPPKNPRTPKPVTGAAPPSTALDMSNILAAMAASQLQSAGAMNQMMTGMMTAMATMMTATKPTKDPMEVALEMAKVMRGNEPGATSASDFLSAFKQGMEIGEKVGGSGNDDDGVMSAVNKGLDTLGVIVAGIVEGKKAETAAATRQIAPRPVAVVGPGGAAPLPSDVSPIGPGGNVTDIPEPSTTDGAVTGTIRPWVAAARPYIGQLFSAAAFLSPDAAAETIAKNMDDDAFFDLVEDISDQSGGGFGARLPQYFPQVKTVDPNWMGEVIRVLLTDYVDGDDTDGDGGVELPGDGAAPPPTA